MANEIAPVVDETALANEWVEPPAEAVVEAPPEVAPVEPATSDAPEDPEDEFEFEYDAAADVSERLGEALAPLEETIAGWQEALNLLDPDDEDYAENVTDLIAARDAEIAEHVEVGVTEALAPLYEQVAEQQIQAGFERANEVVAEVIEAEGLGDLDQDAVLLRAAELWDELSETHGETEEVAEHAIVEAVRSLAAENEQAAPQEGFSPEAHAWMAQGDRYLHESVDELAYAARYGEMLVAADKRPDLFSVRDKPSLEAPPAEHDPFWTRSENDEMSVAFNWGREAAAKGS